MWGFYNTFLVPLKISPFRIIHLMLLSGEFILSANWGLTPQGRGLDPIRFTRLWISVLDPVQCALSDVVLIVTELMPRAPYTMPQFFGNGPCFVEEPGVDFD